MRLSNLATRLEPVFLANLFHYSPYTLSILVDNSPQKSKVAKEVSSIPVTRSCRHLCISTIENVSACIVLQTGFMSVMTIVFD